MFILCKSYPGDSKDRDGEEGGKEEGLSLLLFALSAGLDVLIKGDVVLICLLSSLVSTIGQSKDDRPAAPIK